MSNRLPAENGTEPKQHVSIGVARPPLAADVSAHIELPWEWDKGDLVNGKVYVLCALGGRRWELMEYHGTDTQDSMFADAHTIPHDNS